MKVKQVSNTQMRVSFSHSEKPILDYVVGELELMGGMDYEIIHNDEPKYPDSFLIITLPIIVDILSWASEYEIEHDMESIR